MLILFSERDRRRGFAHFVSQVKRVGGVEVFRQPAVGAALPQLFKHFERVGALQMQAVADYVNFTFRPKDTVICIFYFASKPIQVVGRRLD